MQILKLLRKITTLLFIKVIYAGCFLIVSVQTINAQNIIGKIRDESDTPIPYVNIGIPAKGFGVTSNEDGEFKFKITTEIDFDTVIISAIGYKKTLFSFKEFKEIYETKNTIYLKQEVYEIPSVTIRPDDFETKILGFKKIEDLECQDLGELTKMNDSIKIEKYKQKCREKGLNEKEIGYEFGNLIKIKKGLQTYIDQISFKTCEDIGDTAVYRINIYREGEVIQRKMSVVGVVKLVSFSNILKEPIVVKVIGGIQVHNIDLTSQNIEVDDDFIIGLECIYTSNMEINVGVYPTIYGSTNLYLRPNMIDNWVKFPLIDLTFVSATVRYRKQKPFYRFW